MKKETLKKTNAWGVCTLLLVFLFTFSPWLIRAQEGPDEYKTPKGTLVGTTDTRIVASVYETATTVTMKLSAVGYLNADMLSFAFFYDPSVLLLLDQSKNVVSDFNDQQGGTALKSPDLGAGWTIYGSHKDVGNSFILNNVSGHSTMRAIWYDLAYFEQGLNNTFVVPAGDVKHILECTFEKQTGFDFTNDAIGIGVKTNSINNTYQPAFGNEGFYVWYNNVQHSSITNKEVDPNLFMYRSGNSVTTATASGKGASFATLNGSFRQGAEFLPISDEMLNNVSPTYTGKLHHDSVKQYGFIYTTEDIQMTSEDFSDFFKLNNVPQAVPIANGVSTGTYTIGGKTFNIVIVGDNEGDDNDNDSFSFNKQITGLLPHETYYAWAYIQYVFETSNVFQAIGERIEFETSDCIALNIGTVHTLTEPLCGDDQGSIQVFVTGGSEKYLYSYDGNTFDSYENGIITGLKAGTYTITVKDEIQTSCPATSIFDIVLHNGTTDLNLAVTSGDAQDCESEDGTLYLSVTGGIAPYKFFLDGSEEDEEVLFGMISGLATGAHVVEVKDFAGCVATSGSVFINSSESNLAITNKVEENTECGLVTGKLTFTVEGSENGFSYQLDGFPIVKLDKDGTVIIEELTAGVHILRVWDDCKEIMDTVTISNGANALAFTAEVTNEIMACGKLIEGSITLKVTNGTPDFEYSIDGGTIWNKFEEDLYEITIADLHTGIYRIIVKDGEECMYEMNQIVVGREISTPINIGTIFAVLEPTCGQPNGKIQVFATGGSGNYLFSTNGIDFEPLTDGIISGLEAGYYTISVKDADYDVCIDVVTKEFVLHNQKTDLSIVVTTEDADDCESETGALYITVFGGQPEYTYFLDGEEKIVVNGVIDELAAGTYFVEVKDGNLCTATSGEVRISAKDSQLAISNKKETNTECGFSTGMVAFTVTGSEEYSYQLDGYAVVENVTNNNEITISGLAAGVHYLKVWDGCGEVRDTIIISNGTGALAFTAEVQNEMLDCKGELAEGSITLTVTNGTPDFKYRFDGGDWNDFDPESYTVTISELHAGTYRVEVIDNNNCTYEVNQIIIGREIYTPIQIGSVFAHQEPTCGNNNGKIQVVVTGGSGQYEYSTDGEHFASFEDGIITGLVAGTYNITVKDVVYTNCFDAVFYGIVLPNGNTDLAITMTSEDAQTCSSEDGILNVIINGGKKPYQSVKLNGEEVEIINGKITGKEVGTYILEVTDKAGCVATSGEVRINGNNSDLFVNVTHKDTECGNTTGTITFTVTGSADYTYQLDGYAEVTPEHNNEITLTGITAGVHYLKVWDDCKEIEEEIIITNGENGLEFELETTPQIVTCEGDIEKGSILLTVLEGNAEFMYRVDGGEWIEFDENSFTASITDLHTGVYKIEVIDGTNCMYEVNNVTIKHETSYGTLLTPPVATSPQTFCESATVANLQATGEGIRWYLANEIDPLEDTYELIDGEIYYAVQSIGTCESSTRTAVKVIIDNTIVVTPNVVSPQEICSATETFTIVDIATDGNTNIVWYKDEEGGDPITTTEQLEAGTYYAAIEAGTCQTSLRLPVEISITTSNPYAPEVDSPQAFCEGAMIANIAVPNNKIVWYDASEGGNKLSSNHPLENGLFYYAAQEAGTCESTLRTAVKIEFTTPGMPDMEDTQKICGKSTLADLTVTGAGIVWYDQQEGGNQLPLDTELEVGESYWAAQSSGICEGERMEVTITDDCYVVYGTMFPFVKTADDQFDSQFPVTVKLYEVPEVGNIDPFAAIFAAGSIDDTFATYYDATKVYIPRTPLNPGEIGNFNNPGEKINWETLGKIVENIDNTLAGPGQQPSVPVGMFKFENLVPGDYILEISRAGFITRWGMITIEEGVDIQSVGHRELIAGDVDGNFQIDAQDISKARHAMNDYDPDCDLNADKGVNELDILIIQGNIKAYIGTYEETMNWAKEYK